MANWMNFRKKSEICSVSYLLHQIFALSGGDDQLPSLVLHCSGSEGDLEELPGKISPNLSQFVLHNLSFILSPFS